MNLIFSPTELSFNVTEHSFKHSLNWWGIRTSIKTKAVNYSFCMSTSLFFTTCCSTQGLPDMDQYFHRRA